MSKPQTVELKLVVSVADPERVKLVATAWRHLTGDDPDWTPRDLADAVYELMVHSPFNREHLDFGMEIIDSEESVLD